jgi:hypothetical protein
MSDQPFKRWFHGFLQDEDLKQIFLDKNPGSWLVRFSNSSPKSFAVSILIEKKGQKSLEKWLIKGKAGKEVEYKGKSFENIFALVKYLKGNQFPSGATPIAWWLTKRI